MIIIKGAPEIASMRRAGKVTGQALLAAGAAIAPGITTAELDRIIKQAIISRGGRPSFLGYGGFPGSACISVNEEVIHGIPGPRVLRDGDIVKVDVGAFVDGFTGDSAATFAVGTIGADRQRLIDVTRQSFYEGIKFARTGYRVSDISHAIQAFAESHGYSVVRSFCGHGVGAAIHEDPEVPNYGKPGHGPRLIAGMTLAIEPMVNAGTYEVDILEDRWTVVTRDRKLSAHYEHCVLITDGDPELLTDRGEGLYGAK